MTYLEKVQDTRKFSLFMEKEADRLPELEKAMLVGIARGMLAAQEAAEARKQAS